jgi:hypothetical protein
MNMTHVIGGALINTSVTPISEGTPPDPRLQASIAAFLSMMDKAYAAQSSDEFLQIEEVFLSEVDVFLDNRILAGREEEPHSEPLWEARELRKRPPEGEGK